MRKICLWCGDYTGLKKYFCSDKCKAAMCDARPLSLPKHFKQFQHAVATSDFFAKFKTLYQKFFTEETQ